MEHVLTVLVHDELRGITWGQGDMTEDLHDMEHVLTALLHKLLTELRGIRISLCP